MSDRAGWEGALPDAVRARVVALAADTLGALADDEVPTALKPFRSWAPARRRTRAATPLATAVERDVVFRQRVSQRAAEADPELAAALAEDAVPPAADPGEAAALAYLLRSPRWAEQVRRAADAEARVVADAASGRDAEELARLRAELDQRVHRHRDEMSRAEAARIAADVAAAAAVQELRAEKGARRRAERTAAEATARAETYAQDIVAARASADADIAAARREAAADRDALQAAKRAVREGHRLEDARARLLLDTVVEASAALRRELALPPLTTRPADVVASLDAHGPAIDTAAVGGDRALLPDDPGLLDQLISLPQAHLIVDGYNVTKTGFPDLTLEQQRARLIGGLAALAAQSGAEVTCCFDGAALAGRIPPSSARGVRVLFSRTGQTADDLIRRLVRAEPPGRPVTVVSSDREVADGVRRWGARPLAATALVRRLARG